MLRHVLKRISVVVGAGAVLLVLGFGTTQAIATPEVASACDQGGQIGSCPPFTRETCHDTCVFELGFADGDCILGCCECTV